MFFEKIRLTAAGKAAIILTIAGQETIHFTRLVLGNGPAQEAGTATGLSNQIAEGAITDFNHNGETAELTVQYDNFGLQEGFVATEMGIMARDKNNAEYLYAYTTAEPRNASYIPSYAEAPATQYEFHVAVAVGDAEHVEAVIGEAGGYARKEELESHINNKSNPHGVTAKDVGLENVDNVSTNQQRPTYKEPGSVTQMKSGETMATAFAKMAAAVTAVIRLEKEMAEHGHPAEDLTEGVLGINRGGTGGATPDAARRSLGLNAIAITRDVSTDAVEFEAGEYVSTSVPLPAVEGYSPMAIAGWQITELNGSGSYDRDVDVNNVWIGGNTMYVHLVNRRSAANRCGFWARVLYIKNT